jgi:hypothetical protein
LRELIVANLLPLSEKTAAEIEALARKISVAHRLDGEIQAELRGHVEDKVRGYVQGEIGVSEADALLLATAHFGEMGVIQGMFRGVHRSAHAVSLGRRVAAAFVASQMVVVVMASVNVLRTVLVDYPVAHFAEETENHSIMGVSVFFEFVFAALSVLVLWGILGYWRKRQREGRRVWFESFSLVGMITVVICVYVLVYSLGIFLRPEDWFLYSSAMQHFHRATLSVHMGGEYYFAYWVFSRCCMGVSALLWIGWVDAKPRTVRSLVCAAIFWVIQSPVWMVFTALWSSVVDSVSWGRFIAPRFGGLLMQFDASARLTPRVDLLVGLIVLMGYFLVTRSKRGALIGH